MTVKKVPTAGDADVHLTQDSTVGANPSENQYQKDLELMNLAAAGDPQAQKTVALRLARRVRRLSKMMLLDETLADDASQTALIEILQSARTFRGQSSLERWADRITARTVLRQKRDERRRDRLVEPLADTDSLTGDIDAPSSMTEATPRPIEEYLASLSEPQREVLLLKHSLDYTTEEIAELTGTALGTVKDRLVAARRQLRKLIQRDLALGIQSQRGGR